MRLGNRDARIFSLIPLHLPRRCCLMLSHCPEYRTMSIYDAAVKVLASQRQRLDVLQELQVSQATARTAKSRSRLVSPHLSDNTTGWMPLHAACKMFVDDQTQLQNKTSQRCEEKQEPVTTSAFV